MMLPFLSPNLRMTGKSIQFAAQAVLMNRQKKINDFQLFYFPFKPEKNKNK